ncbi:hypothetical protein MSG37_08460 [Shewanella sp. 1CM18E]|uniref:hypothetical protein n=1 Tax=Shewanella sp. 1CM18E TaxID=2929169 RepID=UPI0020BF3CFA|nr:hypothetical protein [Shewanella sp. 1CM18E]MCK8044916.1 hypothetical protein [Shewanella sp. 1CM18E]
MEPLVDFIRLFSQHGRLTTANQLIAVAGLELEINDVNSEHLKLIEETKYQDIMLIHGDIDSYFYSDRYIVESYAKQWLGVTEDKVSATMADYIRRYSALGELVPEDNFTHAPYNLAKADLDILPQQFMAMPEFADINYQHSENGTGHYFSTMHIKASYAKVLANHDPFEWSV